VRLFVALDVPTEVRERLASLIREFRALAPQLKWVRAESLHLTLKFIGETESAKLEGIRAAIGGIRTGTAFQVRYQGLGFFPNEKHPRVFWAGIRAERELVQLASGVDAALAALGFVREERPFAPHLTLARLDGTRLPEPFRDAFATHAKQEFGAAQATEFQLIESKLKSAGAEYTTVQTFSFASEK
jgi:2'-5' RNA ligase